MTQHEKSIVKAQGALIAVYRQIDLLLDAQEREGHSPDLQEAIGRAHVIKNAVSDRLRDVCCLARTD